MLSGSVAFSCPVVVGQSRSRSTRRYSHALGVDPGCLSTYRVDTRLGVGRLALALSASTGGAAEGVAEGSGDAGLTGLGSGWVLGSCGGGSSGMGLVGIPTSASDGLEGAADSVHGFGARDGLAGGDGCRLM